MFNGLAALAQDGIEAVSIWSTYVVTPEQLSAALRQRGGSALVFADSSFVAVARAYPNRFSLRQVAADEFEVTESGLGNGAGSFGQVLSGLWAGADTSTLVWLGVGLLALLVISRR